MSMTLPQHSALIKTQDKRRYFKYQQKQRVVAEKQSVSQFGRIRHAITMELSFLQLR